MRGLILGFVIITSIIIIYHNRQFFYLTRITAGPAARQWNVAGGYDNAQEAAELLASTHTKTIEFMRHLKKKYHIDEPDDVIAAEGIAHSQTIQLPNDLHQIVDHLLDNYNPDVFYENDPLRSTETSYTINKGDAMYICLRRKDDPTKLVDADVLFFAHLHESAHIANYRGWGHENDFWASFKFLLHEAQLAGVYAPVDYSKSPVDFCGLRVNYSPLHDNSLPNLWM